MSKLYRIWLEIEEYDEETEESNPASVAQPESLEVEFETLEVAETCRDMILNLYDIMSTYIVKTYAPVYARVEELEQQAEDALGMRLGEDL